MNSFIEVHKSAPAAGRAVLLIGAVVPKRSSSGPAVAVPKGSVMYVVSLRIVYALRFLRGQLAKP